MDAEEVPYMIPFKVLSFILPNLSKKHKSLGAGAGAEGVCMTVEELLNHYHGSFDIYYFEGPYSIDIIEFCDSIEELSEEVLDLKVFAFYSSEAHHGIGIQVERPFWV